MFNFSLHTGAKVNRATFLTLFYPTQIIVYKIEISTTYLLFKSTSKINFKIQPSICWKVSLFISFNWTIRRHLIKMQF